MEHTGMQLTSSEISALWTVYNECTSTNCFYKHFLEHLTDKKIKPIIEDALSLNNDLIKRIKTILTEEKFPIPIGFSDEDVDLSAPALFTDLYALSFVYRQTRVVNTMFTTMLCKVAREDVFVFLQECLSSSIALYKRSIDLMLSKGIYDRPPKIAYPERAEMLHKQSTLLETWLGEGRPLNVLELGEIFCTVERNYIGLIMLMGFIQVATDNDVKAYFKKGKKLSEQQINTFNKILQDDNEMPITPITMEVTDSTTSPFSDRLMLFFMTSTNEVGLTTLSKSLSVSMRKDLGVQYTRFITDVVKYGSSGLKLMVEKGWMEKPPQSANKKGLSQ